jgi:hypothetical protein
MVLAIWSGLRICKRDKRTREGSFRKKRLHWRAGGDAKPGISCSHVSFTYIGAGQSFLLPNEAHARYRLALDPLTSFPACAGMTDIVWGFGLRAFQQALVFSK